MKGSTGTPMIVEYAPRKKGVHCKYCKHLVYGGKNSPYTCSLKNKPRHYTSVCICRKFEKKDEKKEQKNAEQEKARKEYLAKVKAACQKKRKEKINK